MLRRYYAKQLLLGRWQYWRAFWRSLWATPVEAPKCGHGCWEEDDEGVSCCVFCGVTADTQRRAT